jgi:phosphocarrier protein
MAELQRQITIINELGLHARAASKLVSLASKFTELEIKIGREDMTVNGKSIMGVLMLAACKGTELTFTAVGDDPQRAAGALDAIAGLVNERFGEER